MNYLLRLWMAYSLFIIVIVPAYAIVQYELYGVSTQLDLDTLDTAGMIEELDYDQVLDVDELLPTVLGLVILPPAVAAVVILAGSGANAVSEYGIPRIIRIRDRLGSQNSHSRRAVRFQNYRRQAREAARKVQNASQTNR